MADSRMRIVIERVEVAAGQVLEAVRADDPLKLKAALTYWFSVMYDEGLQQARHVTSETESLRHTVDKLRIMNQRLLDREVAQEAAEETRATVTTLRPRPWRRRR